MIAIGAQLNGDGCRDERRLSLPPGNFGSGRHDALRILGGSLMVTTAIRRLSRIGLMVFLLSVLGPAHDAHAATVSAVFQVQGVDDGALPTGTLTELDGTYYGVTTNADTSGGIVYSIDLRTKKETVLYRFSGSATMPEGSLVALDGKLYGSTFYGGYIFSFDPTIGAENNVYALPAFSYATGSLVAHDGVLYGTGNGCGDTGGGCIFSVDPASGAGTIRHSFAKTDQEVPDGLTWHGDVFLGTTYNGKREGQKKTFGTIFKFDPISGHFATVFSFTASGDGLEPNSGLIDAGGVLYGTTQSGGQSGAGAVFSFDPHSRQETVVHSFASATGVTPVSSLRNVGGKLYGVTYAGGASGLGVVY
jgi:uncharacterized repeat protein (TIGR03803 family)